MRKQTNGFRYDLQNALHLIVYQDLSVSYLNTI